jgi:hypothetical protein
VGTVVAHSAVSHRMKNSHSVAAAGRGSVAPESVVEQMGDSGHVGLRLAPVEPSVEILSAELLHALIQTGVAVREVSANDEIRLKSGEADEAV